MLYVVMEYIIDHPYYILGIILIILLLLFLKGKLYGDEEEINYEADDTPETPDEKHKLTRKQLVEKTRQYKSGNLAWQELIDILFDANKEYPDDDLIFDLYDLIEHEPKRGGFLGVSEGEWQQRQRKIENILKEFESPLR